MILLLTAPLVAHGQTSASFQSLGVPAGSIDFTPTDVNSDGSVIVGTSLIPGNAFSFSARGFLWTAAGFQDLGSLGGDSVRPMRISGQGDVVVGLANLVPGSVASRIFRWTAATGIQDLGPTFGATPASISNDGTTIAALLAGSGPVRWTAAQGFTPISVPSVADPYDISGDGSVVVANDFGLVYTAYRWTATGGAVALPGLGGCSSDRIANSISSSGAITVGYSTYKSQAARPGDCPPMAVRWNGTTIQQLGFLPNGFRSVAKGVSADGSVVVGYSNTTGNAQVGFIWKSATNKMQDLNQVLAGVPGAASLVVTDAIAVSGNGNVIAAIALNKNTGTFESVRIVLAGATACIPTSCAAQGKNCGTIPSGCGGTLTCGVCTAPQACGGGGTANVCGLATLSSLALNPTSAVGGTPSIGTVTLTSAAPTGGSVATLASGGAAASVPASVTVAAGATSASFTVTTSAVTASTVTSISASLLGSTKTALLTVNPAVACTPTTCAVQGKNCGTISDGCGGTLVCGSCTAPQTCGGGGVANVCGLSTATTALLTVTATGRAGESISSTPAGLAVNVGTTGSASFATGTSVTLSVSNGRSAIWSGGCSSNGAKVKSCTFTINAATSVTANVQ